uniref:Uncharacterized protein n=1 Tax=Helianthus annuus TaxID=4232 RepID=A0A251T892_HELAN
MFRHAKTRNTVECTLASRILRRRSDLLFSGAAPVGVTTVVMLFQSKLWFGCFKQRLGFGPVHCSGRDRISGSGIGSTRSNRVNSVNPGQHSESTQLTRSTQSNGSMNTVECTLASRALETTSRSRKLASFAQEYSGCISKTRHGWNRGTMKSRVLSGRSTSKRLRLFASAVQ